MDLEKLFGRNGMSSSGPRTGDPKKMAQALKLLNTKVDFKVGDKVKWKPGLKNKESPGYGEICVVSRVVPGRKAVEESGSPYFDEPLEISIMMVDSDGDISEYAVDARRFEKA